MSEHREYAGLVCEAEYGEAWDVVKLGDSDEPLARVIAEDLEQLGRTVTVRYFISDEPKPLEELEANLIRTLVGDAEADYGDRYSDITGYLWTDEELMVGGHDLLEEIRDAKGRYVTLLIEWPETP